MNNCWLGTKESDPSSARRFRFAAHSHDVRNPWSAASTTQSRDQQEDEGKADWRHESLLCAPTSANTYEMTLKLWYGRTNIKVYHGSYGSLTLQVSV